ncbi:acyltransferase [Piscinibacter sp. HJYY11]|uniref:acyltransferase family protein n=1 Tax=Piscinibacter sp. HJYY11 TaxID=2801333 RepID=UPI00191E517D|nr:acyltransferase [Piscinibacter sp. HJYY11]MBL0726219.1 acyltransferase [Piscinibacter sp. HJYY11]
MRLEYPAGGALATSGAQARTQALPRDRPRQPTYSSLNVLRVILGVAVLLYHLGATLALDKYFGVDLYEHIFGFGGARIPFFFVLSGFLLTIVYARDIGSPARAPGFLWRRAFRVYPTYWIILLVVMAPALFFESLRDAIPHDPLVLVKTFLLIPQHPSVAGATGAPVLVAAWTLHYEIAFYLVLAVWIWSRVAGIALCLVLAANMAVCTEWQCGFYNSFLAGGSMLYFAFGAGAAWLARRLPPLPNAKWLTWVAGLTYLFIAVLTHGDDLGVAGAHDPSIYYGMLASLILLCLTRVEDESPRSEGPPWLKVLADSSYAMYLIHFPVISLMCKLLTGAGLRGFYGATVTLVVTLGVCLALSVAFHLLVERRLLVFRGTG